MENERQEDPTKVLQDAIDKLDLFTMTEKGDLAVEEDGQLITAPEPKPLTRIVNLARHYITSFFSDEVRLEKEQRLSKVKQEILRARDIVQSHSLLIEKLKNGNPNEQKLAQSALETIKRYNAIVKKDHSFWNQYDIRGQLLVDEEIKDQPIELPHVFSIKFESHLESHPAQKSLKEFGRALLVKDEIPPSVSVHHPTHKKSAQFMLDTFRMKAIRMIQSHLSEHHSLNEILRLVKQTKIDIDTDSSTDITYMYQVVELAPGSRITFTGSFKRHTDSKFLSMPILNSFHLSSHTEHAGFPYASQRTGWALSEKLVEAFPLRSEQNALFQELDQKRKQLAHQLLFDPISIQKARQLYLSKKEAFEKDKDRYFAFHRQLQEKIIEASDRDTANTETILNEFYAFLKDVQAPYDLLSEVQQAILDHFIKNPAQKLDEEWLEANDPILRKGTHQEKLQTSIHKLREGRNFALTLFVQPHPINHFICLMGEIIGEGSQGILLQYFSEKIGFAPPMLTDFEQKIQLCAFQQQLQFLEEFENQENVNAEKWLENEYERDTKLFEIESIEDEEGLAAKIVQELEVYFPARFFTRYPRKSYLPPS